MVKKSFTKNIKGGIWPIKKNLSNLQKTNEPRTSTVDFTSPGNLTSTDDLNTTQEITEDNKRRLIDQFDRELANVKPENKQKFKEYVEHEWNNCRGPDKKILSIKQYTEKIKNDETYPEANTLKTEDFAKMHNRCYLNDKEAFEYSLSNSPAGIFILRPHLGGKRTKARKNKNKKKTKSYKKGRK
jgi:hypothetical protein